MSFNSQGFNTCDFKLIILPTIPCLQAIGNLEVQLWGFEVPFESE